MTDAALLRAFVDELVLAGVRDAVVCPGSRSTPLALALRTAADLTVRVLLDERAAAFFALGLARTSRRPVALLATSGTATVEFAPAVVEASLARVPLVVLTADRPPELRDRGAPQTIDQDHLYGRAAKWYAELPMFDPDAATTTHVRSVVGRAVATAAAGPAGPVHLNLPFREPLLPDAPLAAAPAEPSTRSAGAASDGPAFAAAIAGRRRLDASEIESLAARLRATDRGLIVAGPDDDQALPGAVAALARATGFPVLADPLSGLRTGGHDRSLVIARGDQLARPGPWIERHPPTLVVRTGAMPTSAPITNLIARTRPELIVLDGDAGWRESALVAATFVHADPAATALALAAALANGPGAGEVRAAGEGHGAGEARGNGGAPVAGEVRAAGAIVDRTPAGELGPTSWTAEWLEADAAADDAMCRWLQGLDEPFEGLPFRALADALPDGAILWAGNSMPVRDLDAWLPSTGKALIVRSNRGANGIDGVVSTALGSAAAGGGPVVLVVGDLSFLHDLNALVAAKLHGLSATIVLVNNDGGGIFSFLPQASAPPPGSGLPEHYEELFGTPHGIDVGPIVRALGGTHRRVTHVDFGTALTDALATHGVNVLELRTNRARNLELHRSVAAVVQATLQPLLVRAEAGDALRRPVASVDGH
jgi:2-succinyl-5-enolpyruvyl-6-hydroxy-3-cyclohexene-1-carboxylate synthase